VRETEKRRTRLSPTVGTLLLGLPGIVGWLFALAVEGPWFLSIALDLAFLFSPILLLVCPICAVWAWRRSRVGVYTEAPHRGATIAAVAANVSFTIYLIGWDIWLLPLVG
jgi:hypothetical protein